MRYPAIGGTRFRLYPSYAEGFAEPEVVEVSLPPGTVRAGPSDPSICVVNPVRKDAPYDPPHYVPPFRGPVYAPALPGPDGHFDHIPAETEQFLAAHLYGTVRWTLDVWEHYLRRRIVWLDADAHPQLELIPVVRWPNAQSGPGFLETGSSRTDWIAAAVLPQLRCHGARNRACNSVLPDRRPRASTRSACRFSHFTDRSPIWWH